MTRKSDCKFPGRIEMERVVVAEGADLGSFRLALRRARRGQRPRLQQLIYRPLITLPYRGVGRGCGAGRDLGVGIGLGVGVVLGVTVGVGEGVGVGVGVTGTMAYA